MLTPLSSLEVGSVQRQHQCVSVRRCFGGQEMNEEPWSVPLPPRRGKLHACSHGYCFQFKKDFALLFSLKDRRPTVAKDGCWAVFAPDLLEISPAPPGCWACTSGSERHIFSKTRLSGQHLPFSPGLLWSRRILVTS